MKLRRLKIERLPGIDAPFEIEITGDGFHVVHGPNGIGKSSICRAVEALLWDDGPSRRVSLTGWFELGEDQWQCERDGGKIQWQLNNSDSPPPILPSQHLRHCFFLKLRDLIDTKTSTNDVAVEIKNQMSGGFNLPAIISGLFGSVKPRAARKANDDFQSKLKDLKKEDGNQEQLQRKDDQIDELNALLKQADSDKRRLSYVETAIELANRRSELDELNQKISALPKSLEKLIGDEKERVSKLKNDLNEKNKRRGDLNRDIDLAKREKTASTLNAPLDKTRLVAWRTRSNDLQRTESDLARLKQEHSGACGKLREYLKAVGKGDIKGVELDLEDHGQVFDFLRMAHDHDVEEDAIKERIRLLEKAKLDYDSQENLDKYNDGVDALRAWLRTPDSGSFGNTLPHRRFWLIGATLLIAGGTALAAMVHPSLALIAGIGGGIIVAVSAWRLNRSDPNGHPLAKADFEKLGIDEPERWDLPSVKTRLRALERQIAKLAANRRRASRIDGDIYSLKSKLEGLSVDQKEIEESRQNLLKSLNLKDIPGNAELVDMARALDQLRQARAEEQKASGKVEECKKEYYSLLSNLSNALKEHGQPLAGDAAEVIAGFDLLTANDSQLRRAMKDEERLLGEIERVNGEIDKVEGEINEIFSNLDLERDDSSGLAKLIGQFPDFKEDCDKRNTLKSENDLDCGRLYGFGENALTKMDQTELDKLKSTLSHPEQSVSVLNKQIAEVEAAVKNAKEAHDIENLIEQRDAALANLEDTFDNELFKRVGRLLVDDVEQEHEQIQMPRVLKRARKLFSSFTRNSYDIQLDKAVDNTRLIAIELRTKKKRELAELSDGTRAQLLLAARLAYAEEVERENQLPLFLDEALDQSDPVRYHEIVKSLGQVVKDQGRQIFYFTNDPVDLERIQTALAEEGFAKAQSTDLGRVRNQAESVVDSHSLRIEPRPLVPDPADYPSAEDYAIAVDVRPLDPRRGPNYQHLFHLLWDDLNLLHALLKAGVEWVGQWSNFSVSEYAAKLRTEFPSGPILNLRTGLFVTFCELWNKGRGRPVYSDAIEDSGAISDLYLDGVIAIAAEKHGDGEQLIQALRAKNGDPRLKGFREKNADRLEQYLSENGYIDNRLTLSEDELLPLAMASPAAAMLPDGTPAQCISRWWKMATRANETGPL